MSADGRALSGGGLGSLADHERDGVLRVGLARVRRGGGDARGRSGGDAHGPCDSLHGPGVEVDVVRVEVVRDVGRTARPLPERLQLVLGLRHVAVEEAAVAQTPDPFACVDVHRVPALVELDHHQHALSVNGGIGRGDQAGGVEGKMGGVPRPGWALAHALNAAVVGKRTVWQPRRAGDGERRS